jgi:hypothetical protein
VDAVDTFFASVGWNSRLGRLCRTGDLLRLFAKEDINDSLLDTMVDLLASQMEGEQPEAKTVVLNTDISLVMQIDRLWTAYNTEPQLANIRAIGAQISEDGTKRIVFPVNVRGIHWAVIEISLSARTIRYGDSLGWSLPEEWAERVRRWLRHIAPGEFEVGKPIPVPAQGDGYSCAIIAMNTMLRLVQTEAEPWHMQEREERRWEWIIVICAAEGRYPVEDFGLPRDWKPLSTMASLDTENEQRTCSSPFSHLSFPSSSPSSPATSPRPSSPLTATSSMPTLEPLTDTENSDVEADGTGWEFGSMENNGWTTWAGDDDRTSESSDLDYVMSLTEDETDALSEPPTEHKRTDAMDSSSRLRKMWAPWSNLDVAAVDVGLATPGTAAPATTLDVGGESNERPQKRARVDTRAPPTAMTKGIMMFFAKVTPEEAERRRRAMAEVEREERREEAEAAGCHARATMMLKMEHKKAKAREGKRRQRERQRAPVKEPVVVAVRGHHALFFFLPSPTL